MPNTFDCGLVVTASQSIAPLAAQTSETCVSK